MKLLITVSIPSKLTCILLFKLISFAANAQDTFKIKGAYSRISFHQPTVNPYHSFIFPVSKTIDYSNYPLTAGQILRRESQITGYHRVYNIITNKNKNGFVGNLLGVQRVQRPHPSPGF